jgi:hypothetical protein
MNAKLFNQYINEFVSLRADKRVQQSSESGEKNKKSCGKYNGKIRKLFSSSKIKVILSLKRTCPLLDDF